MICKKEKHLPSGNRPDGRKGLKFLKPPGKGRVGPGEPWWGVRKRLNVAQGDKTNWEESVRVTKW